MKTTLQDTAIRYAEDGGTREEWISAYDAAIKRLVIVGRIVALTERLGRQSTDCKECSGTGRAAPNCHGCEQGIAPSPCPECHDMPCERCDGTGEEPTS